MVSARKPLRLPVVANTPRVKEVATTLNVQHTLQGLSCISLCTSTAPVKRHILTEQKADVSPFQSELKIMPVIQMHFMLPVHFNSIHCTRDLRPHKKMLLSTGVATMTCGRHFAVHRFLFQNAKHLGRRGDQLNPKCQCCGKTCIYFQKRKSFHLDRGHRTGDKQNPQCPCCERTCVLSTTCSFVTKQFVSPEAPWFTFCTDSQLV